MTVNKHLCFISDVVKEKNIYQSKESLCPFCDRDALSDIIDEQDSIILVKNKFPTLANTFQTVLIETNNCFENISTYDTYHMRKLITFGINHWLKMEKSGDFKSVVFYKNHGPMSGGTVNHSHMQIVGLKDIDYKIGLNDEIFEGIEIYQEGSCSINISSKPKVCSTEFNIITTSRNDNFMADNIQNIVKYLLKRCNSFNLFFYQWKRSIICKIVPRYVTSPLFVGFSIPQTSNRLNEIAEEIKNTYYSIKK